MKTLGIVLGVGNVLRGDDGFGPAVAQRVAVPGWMGLDCGTAPENFTSVVVRNAPSRLVIVDAATLGLEAGTLRRVPENRIRDTGMGTHMLPLNHLVAYLSGVVDRITLIGVQPQHLQFDQAMSLPVERAVARLVGVIAADGLDGIPELEPSK